MDPTLPLFPLDDDAGRIPRVDPDLAVAVPGSARPVWLHGTRAAVFAEVRGGCRVVRMDGRRVVTDLDMDMGAVANAVVSPGLLRRERVSAGSSGEETVLVAPTLPLVVLAFRGAGPARLTLTALPDATLTRYRADGSAATVVEEGTGDVLVATALPRTVSWDVEPAPGNGLRLTCADTAGGPDGLRALVLTWGPEASVRAALSGARHLAGHAARAGARAVGDRLTLRSGVPALDDSVDWMHHRLAAGVRLAAANAGASGCAPRRKSTDELASQGAAHRAEAWLWSGLGACAVTDADTAATCLEVLDGLHRREEALLLAGRLALVTGRQRGVQERVVDSERDGPAISSTTLGRLALRTAADAMRHAAPEELVERTRRAGAPPTETRAPAGPASGRRLPTVGGSEPGDPPSANADAALGDALAFLLEGGDTTRPASWPSRSTGSMRSALEAWTAMVAGDADGWARWRVQTSQGLEATEGGVAAWDAFDPAVPPATTGILLAALAHGWLGAHADAPVGRLTLAPRVPGHVTKFGFHDIRVGDATLDLRYVRDGSSHHFELLPRRGRVPPLVVFEPLVPIIGSLEVLVDGGQAEVEAVPGRGGTTIRLQTPLDQIRRVDIRSR